MKNTSLKYYYRININIQDWLILPVYKSEYKLHGKYRHIISWACFSLVYYTLKE